MGNGVPLSPGRGRQTKDVVRPWRKQKRCPDILGKAEPGGMTHA
jgi:hypothetical protein